MTPARGYLVPLLALAVILLVGTVAALRWQSGETLKAGELRRASDLEMAEGEKAALREQIEELKEAASRRDTEIAARGSELAGREAAIAGREDAATERIQSSFQGLLIQQQLIKNLEALKAALPDLSPEVDRLAKEHAQSKAERQRLQEDNAELRRRLNAGKGLESR